jgi:hypothetical protein
MSRKRLPWYAIPAVVLAASLAPAGSSASTRQPVSGTFTTTDSTFESVRQVGEATIIRVSGHIAYTGTFEGTSEFHGVLVAHSDGRAEFQDKETFTGTVNGVPGTVRFSLTGSNDPELHIKAHDTIIGATGELAGLHGQLREVGDVNVPIGPYGTYTGTIH